MVTSVTDVAVKFNWVNIHRDYIRAGICIGKKPSRDGDSAFTKGINWLATNTRKSGAAPTQNDGGNDILSAGDKSLQRSTDYTLYIKYADKGKGHESAFVRVEFRTLDGTPTPTPTPTLTPTPTPTYTHANAGDSTRAVNSWRIGQ